MTAPPNSANGGMLNAHATEVETSTGRFVDVVDPILSTLDLLDIAQGLSLTCRYGGQINRFYSVAEHSVLVHDLLAWQGAPEDVQIAGLFHDAAEAYLGDVVAPLKYALRTGTVPVPASRYDRLSDWMDEAIAARFELNIAALNSAALRTADMWALRIEARVLTHTGGAHWRWPGVLPNDGEKPGEVYWHGGRPPHDARSVWLEVAAAHGVTEPTP